MHPEPSSELFPHQADWGVRGRGATPAAAFEQAALAMVRIVVDPASVAAVDTIGIERTAPDLETLLVDWLDALIYEMSVRKIVLGRFEVTIDGLRLRARAWGERADSSKHDLGTELKGATYTMLKVAQEPDGAWLAQCVVDV